MDYFALELTTAAEAICILIFVLIARKRLMTQAKNLTSQLESPDLKPLSSIEVAYLLNRDDHLTLAATFGSTLLSDDIAAEIVNEDTRQYALKCIGSMRPVGSDKLRSELRSVWLSLLLGKKAQKYITNHIVTPVRNFSYRRLNEVAFDLEKDLARSDFDKQLTESLIKDGLLVEKHALSSIRNKLTRLALAPIDLTSVIIIATVTSYLGLAMSPSAPVSALLLSPIV